VNLHCKRSQNKEFSIEVRRRSRLDPLTPHMPSLFSEAETIIDFLKPSIYICTKYSKVCLRFIDLSTWGKEKEAEWEKDAK
jgi:hypothetical protein